MEECDNINMGNFVCTLWLAIHVANVGKISVVRMNITFQVSYSILMLVMIQYIEKGIPNVLMSRNNKAAILTQPRLLPSIQEAFQQYNLLGSILTSIWSRPINGN